MTTLLNRTGSTMTVGDAFTRVFGPTATVRFEAFDGSATGPVEAPLHLELRSKRGLDYLLTAPSTLGLARAYLQGDLVLEPIDEGNPYDVLRYIEDNLAPSKPSLRELPELARFFRIYRPQIHEIPKEETPGQLRRLARGFTHGRVRDAEAIHHHYDVSNRFYELLLGPSMAYTCAVYPTLDATLEEAQEEKFDLVCRKLELRPGMRLLDVGCGWGGMVRHAVLHYGVTAIGVTLSKEQASWGAERMAREGLDDRGDIRHGDYRDVAEGGFDAVSSIGLTEHIGVANYPAYFRFLRSKLLEGGRLLNHCITRPDNQHPGIPSRGFINRYVFPDGGLTGSGDIVTAMEDQGFEVRHHENLREHYAMTTRDWSNNLSANWDAAVAEAGLNVARVWGLYLAGSRLSFERNRIQLHQVLASKTTELGESGFGLRPTWGS
ncbi:MAG TPA: class I SAM-dependent methyltransferase [Lapillicoccus sp.]|nr:class I SAM-dependent methyltransferase [Lapillicoccus sp.]